MTARACKRCGMPLEFRVGPSGKIMVLQRVRSVYVLTREGTVNSAAPLLFGAEAVYVSHFETCPHASEFSGSARR